MSQISITKRVWDGRLDSERKCRYFSYLADKYSRIYKRVALVIAVSSLISGATFIVESTPSAVPAVFALLSALAAVVLITFDFSAKAAKAESASDYFRRLSDSWKGAWWSQYDDDIKQRIVKLEMQDIAGPYVPIEEDSGLNKRCQSEAVMVVTAEYEME